MTFHTKKLAALLICAASTFAAAGDGAWRAATQPAIMPTPDAVIRLWPSDPPATQAYDPDDTLVPRGKQPPYSYMGKDFAYPSMAAYLPEKTAATAAVVICPGGGYAWESVNGEGVNAAKKFAENGVVAFVLKYRLPDGHPPADDQLPVPQQDVFRAVQLVRANAEKYHVDPKRIGVVGFSAGGHLASTAVTMFDDAASFAAKAGNDAASKLSARPDFGVLIYPVITMRAATHGGSRKNLLGDAPTEEQLSRFSSNERVTANTPPLFIVHAADDKTVPVANAVMMAGAAAKAGVPCELHLLHAGGHGFGLGRTEETQQWFDQCMSWLRVQKFVDSNK